MDEQEEGGDGGVGGGGSEPDAEEHREFQLLPHQETLLKGLTIGLNLQEIRK